MAGTGGGTFGCLITTKSTWMQKNCPIRNKIEANVEGTGKMVIIEKREEERKAGVQT